MAEGVDLEGLGHNSTGYIHTVAEVLKLALADRDEFYGDPDFAKVPTVGLLSDAYAAERRQLIDPMTASHQARPGDPWKFQPSSGMPRPALTARRSVVREGAAPPASPDTTTVNVVSGGTGYAPVKGDFDGDAMTDLATYQASTGTWLVRLSRGNYASAISRTFGSPVYVPLPQYP